MFVDVLWPSSEEIASLYVGGKQQLLTLDLLDGIRALIDWENGLISSRIVAHRFTLCRIAVDVSSVCCACVCW